MTFLRHHYVSRKYKTSENSTSSTSLDESKKEVINMMSSPENGSSTTSAVLGDWYEDTGN